MSAGVARRLEAARALLIECESLLEAAARRLTLTSRDFTALSSASDRRLVAHALCEAARHYEHADRVVRELERARELTEHDPVTGRPVGEGIAGTEAAIRADVAEMRRRMGGETP